MGVVTIKWLWLLLIIPLAILALLLLIILTAGLKIKIIGNNEDLIKLRFYVYGIRVFSFGVNDEKPPARVRVSDYALEKFERRRRREEKKLRKRAARKLKEVAEPKEETYKTVPDVMYIIKFVLNLIKVFCTQFAGKLRIRLRHLEVSVATGDPASTAVLYGAVVQGVGYLMEFLRNNTDFDVKRRAPLAVRSDFCSDKTQLNIVLTVNIHLRRILRLIWRSGIHSPADLRKFVKVKKVKNKNKPESAA